MIGAAIVGCVIAINDGDGAAAQQPGSDIRLKRNIRWVETLDNGIRLHAFQYLGDNRIFVGVLAQEILEMPEYKEAVVELEGGYLAVDFSKLNLKVVGITERFAASKIALSKI